MSESPPRLRMFAGPNGSGKSTLKYYLPAKLLGIYLNPDEIEQEIRSRGFLDFQKYRIKPVSADISSFFKNSDFLNQAGFRNADERLQLTGNRLYFDGEEINSYFASAVTDLLRQMLLEQKKHRLLSRL